MMSEEQYYEGIAVCPECLEDTLADELRMFGGICESCAEEDNDDDD